MKSRKRAAAGKARPSRGDAASLQVAPLQPDQTADTDDATVAIHVLDDTEYTGGDADLPQITRLPEGIEVVEGRMGRAIAQWILHVRCECGRRWFEVEEIDTVRCPRCGLLLRVEVEGPHMPP